MNISTCRSATLSRGILAALILFVPLFAATQNLCRLSMPTDSNVSVEQIPLASSAMDTHEGLDEETRELVLMQLWDADPQIQKMTHRTV